MTFAALVAIPDDFGQGGANLAPGGETGLPTLATVLQGYRTAIRQMQGVDFTSLTNVADVYIDPTAGNDTTGTGAIALPLKTHAEFRRRIDQGSAAFVGGTPRISWNMVVHILGDLPVTDPICLKAVLTAQFTVQYVGGTLTQLAAGSFTAVTLARSGTNTPLQVTDTGLGATTWTSLLGKRIRRTNSTAGTAWVAKDLTANAARVSGAIHSQATVADVGATAITLAIADTYVVEDLRKVYLGDIMVVPDTSGGATNIAELSFIDLEFLGQGATFHQPQVSTYLRFQGCKFDGTYGVTGFSPLPLLFFGCMFSGGLFVYGGDVTIQGCLFTSIFQMHGGRVNVSLDTLVQGTWGITICGGNVKLGTVGVFDTITQSFHNPAGDGVLIGGTLVETGGGSLYLATVLSGGHLLYGSGNAGVGLNLGVSAKYQTTMPTITGTGGDLQLGLVKTGRSFDPAGNGTYSTAEIATTWANMNAAVDATHFGGNAHNLNQDVHFTIK